MHYTYAALLLDETGEELNERNITAVLEAAGTDVTASRVKALVAALEGVEVDASAASRPTSGATDDAGPRDAPDSTGPEDVSPGRTDAETTDAESE